ncbi:MAG: glycoside hydrolase family 2 TIM barrel-domain containing protein [Muribaculaceae bacterium]
MKASSDVVPTQITTYPLPELTASTAKASISLNGKWQFRYDDKSRWTDIEVPGEAVMQGYGIKHDTPFYYRTNVLVPADYAGKSVILRFDGVYSHAVLYVNGKQVREHHGGFSRWEADITSYVKPGKKNQIMLTVEDRLDEISYASGYAHHPIGGILRGVTLFALPKEHLSNVVIDARLDSLYCDAHLKFTANFAGGEGTSLKLRLTDVAGKEVAQRTMALTSSDVECGIDVAKPHKWDAEHPYLYNLEVGLYRGGALINKFTRHVGFRNIEIVKNRMLVNGMPVKLRGACRHDIHPTLGRSTNRTLDSLDVQMFKQSNMNFVRTSHYPPSEDFLEFCDRYGIYVESETAVCFVDTHRQRNYAPGRSQNDEAFTSRYLCQMQEMVQHFRSHACIAFWSIGNESSYGKNFQMCYDWVKANDTSRPAIFSYPGIAMRSNAKVYDILSMHYPGVDGNMEQWGATVHNFATSDMPAIFDEWAHPACYTYATLRNDPNIREFWGQSLDMMWQGVLNSTGALGGAIWGYIDEVFAVPTLKRGDAFWKEFARTGKPEGFRGDCVGYGEWGIVDVWRRPKPEFWGTKKAYSPVRLLTTHLADFTPGQQLSIAVANRFDHTNLNEISATYSYRGKEYPLAMCNAEPHQKGLIVIPAQQWECGDTVEVSFADASGMNVDRYCITLGKKAVEMPKCIESDAIAVSETDDAIIITGKGFTIPFSKATGLIANASTADGTLIENGPYLNLYINLNHLSGAEVRKIADYISISQDDWKLGKFAYHKLEKAVAIAISGTYGKVDVAYSVVVTAKGEISIDYDVQGVPNGYLREMGLMFEIPETAKWLQWQRQGYWDCYPENSMSGNKGAVDIYESQQSAYGEQPRQPWALDTRNYYYWSDAGIDCNRPLTNTAKSMKENIYYYTLKHSANSAHGISAISADASVACRLNKSADDRLRFYVNNRWDYPEIAWGNYCKIEEAIPCHGALKFIIR